MITPRTTRLVRVADLHGFREAAVALACAGTPFDARDRLVVVPTRAAAAYLVRSIENRFAADRNAVVLPELVTRDEMLARLAERLPRQLPALAAPDREVLMGASCRDAVHEGYAPPFRLRPGLIAEILRFYDALRHHQKDVSSFERLTLGALEPGAVEDRGAERLVRQTRFLASAFRHFERRCAATGEVDEHALSRLLIESAADRPWRHIVVAVGDRASDPHGLYAADWDVLSRIAGLERLDILATDRVVAGDFHERIHQLLPGLEELRFETEPAVEAMLLIPPGGTLVHVSRDREEEVAGFARRVRQMVRNHEHTALDRMAMVVQRPLPYVYIAREVLRSAGIPCQTFDALPLAAEPYAAALDLVCSFVASGFGRSAAVALLRSPHFHFEHDGRRLTTHDVRALDKALLDARYLGDLDVLDRFDLRGAAVLRAIGQELSPLRSPAPCASHLDVLLTFLSRYTAAIHEIDPDLRPRQLRSRAAIAGILAALRDGFARHDAEPADFDTVAATVRRWIESHTFAPRAGESGVHLVDAASAPFGDFDVVQLAGLVDGEWPERPKRNVFYSQAVLRDLGWPGETARIERARATFADLLRLPAAALSVSTFTLEDDAVVAASSFVDELEPAGLEAVEYDVAAVRIFDYEAPDRDPVARDGAEFRGFTGPHVPAAHSLSALERFQDCPFKYFAADVLKLEDAPEDEATLSPRARGRFIHEVFQRFFEAWDGRANGTITVDRLSEARELFADVAGALLAQLPEADAALERARLFGSAIATGIVDVVLGLEAARGSDVRERWLEYRLEGEFSLGAADGRRVPLKGVADRIDLLDGYRLRVIDYKSGYPPNPKRALQVPVYALCAQERLEGRDGCTWQVDEAAYIAFSGKRLFVPVLKAGADGTDVLASARERLFDAVGAIGRGEFPPRPHDEMMCGYCAYSSVCRKDYVADE